MTNCSITKADIIRLAVVTVWLGGSLLAAAAPQVEFTVQPAVIRLGESATCNLTIRGMENVPAPKFPAMQGLQINGPAVQRNISMVNGRMDRSFTYSYNVVGTAPGQYTIGPFSYEVRGETIHLPVLQIQVVGPEGSSSDESITDWLFARLEAGQTNLYSQQNVALTLSVYISPKLSVARDISLQNMPEAGLSNHQFHELQTTREVIDGRIYDVRKFRTDMRALTEGRFDLQPSLRLYMLVQKKQERQRGMFNDPFFNSFFERTEKQPVDIAVDGVTLQVSALPRTDRPDSFSGAVGQFDMQLSVSPQELNAGEPITVTAEIKGHGNMDAVGMPDIFWGDEIKAYEPRLSTKQLNDAGSSGRKVFEQVLIPRNDTVTELPAVSFSYFDPQLGSYKTVSRGPFAVTVHPDNNTGAQLLNGGSGAPRNTRILGSDIVYLKPPP